MRKIIRVATVPESLNILLKGQLNFLSENFYITAVSGGGFHLDEIKEREHVEIKPIEMQRRISPFKDFVSLIRLYIFFKQEKPDIVHSITPKAGLLSMLAAKFAGVPIRIHTFTGLIFPYKTGLFQKMLIFMDRLLCWSATNIYPEGLGVKEDLVKYKITNKVLKVIGNGNINGVDLDFFDVKQVNVETLIELKNSLNITEEDFVFIFVGRLVADKGVNELIKSFNVIGKDYKKIKLILVGNYEQDLDPLHVNTLEAIKENKDIIAVGFQKDIRPYLGIANCFVFPSYREGFPNVLLQAGAMGLPILASNISGCNEIVIPNINGVLFESRNAQDLENKMLETLNSSELLLKLKGNSRKQIANRFDKNYLWNEILNEYNLLINDI